MKYVVFGVLKKYVLLYANLRLQVLNFKVVKYAMKYTEYAVKIRGLALQPIFNFIYKLCIKRLVNVNISDISALLIQFVIYIYIEIFKF